MPWMVTIMVRHAPSNAGGIGGRGRSTTVEDSIYMNEFTTNYFVGGTNVLAADQPITILTPHHNLHHTMISREGNRTNQHQACDQRLLPTPRSNTSSRGSLWSDSQALLSFRDQLRQFDCGTRPISSDCNGSKNRSVLDESAIQPTPDTCAIT
jgi:hypothetical protein